MACTEQRKGLQMIYYYGTNEFSVLFVEAESYKINIILHNKMSDWVDKLNMCVWFIGNMYADTYMG